MCGAVAVLLLLARFLVTSYKIMFPMHPLQVFDGQTATSQSVSVTQGTAVPMGRRKRAIQEHLEPESEKNFIPIPQFAWNREVSPVGQKQ